MRKFIRSACFWAALAVVAGGCLPDSPPSGVPSDERLCRVVPHQTSVDDAIRILGTPTARETSAAFDELLYMVRSNFDTSMPGDLALWFRGGVFDSATSQNFVLPSCWTSIDAGVP